jgi:membrane protease YdiL (CAAX protease family)
MINTPVKQQIKSGNVLHPALQFLIFIGVLIGALIIGNLIGVGVIVGLYGLKSFTALSQANTTAPHFAAALWILQTAGTTLPILATPVFFATLVVSDTKKYIRANFKFPAVLIVLVLAIMFFSSPIIEFLSNINQKMVLPHFLQWMRDSEDTNEKLIAVLLKMNTVWDMLIDVIFIGLLTAIVEEFMFRGCLQTILEKWFKNTHVAIWVTAILFSAFHMEFFGFLPRLMLGVLFGYFVVWSGSVWPAVWAHFLNNGTAVVVTYLYKQKLTKLNPDDQHVFNYAAYLISFIIILFLFWVYRNVATNKKPVQV